MEIKYSINQSSLFQVEKHLLQCDADFEPPLSERQDIEQYAKKIEINSTRFEAWSNEVLVGLIAVYNNEEESFAYITNVSVYQNFSNNGIATNLMKQIVEYSKKLGLIQVKLEVAQKNTTAIKLYEKIGFILANKNEKLTNMSLYLNERKNMSVMRNYNDEIEDTKEHKYAYGFDFDVMHPYMIKSFEPFFNNGDLLELGSFKGDFTRRFLSYFDEITCVEASDVAVSEAKQKLDGINTNIEFLNARFETVSLPKKYDNIVLTHVLEHLDDPVSILKRINNEWLTDNGRFFLVCPNANAPSRQIAVKMGLISHNSAVTPAESEHGHRCTYTLDTLERDALEAGLKVVFRSGIFFKALANFQWDKLLGTDIISNEYLDGCYQLGQQYPDLCSSIFLMCEKGD